jgi:hypothetical protein
LFKWTALFSLSLKLNNKPGAASCFASGSIKMMRQRLLENLALQHYCNFDDLFCSGMKVDKAKTTNLADFRMPGLSMEILR